MPTLLQSKHPATFTFFLGPISPKNPPALTCDGLFHLLEYTAPRQARPPTPRQDELPAELREALADNSSHFWFGMAQVNAKYDALAQINAQAIEKFGQLGQFQVRIKLDDGRMGAAICSAPSANNDRPSDYVEVSLMGVSALALPRQ